MKAEVFEISPCLKRLEVEVTAEEVAEELDRAYEKLNKKAKIKGFRAGKVPRKILERYHKVDAEHEVLEKLLPESCFQVIKEKGLKAVGPPKVNEVKFEPTKPLFLSATVEVRPEITVKDFTGAKFEKKIVQVTDKDVDGEIAELREVHGSLEAAGERPAMEEDYLIVDYDIFDGDKILVDKSGRNFPLILGSGRLLPDVERHLLGMRRGEQKDFTISLGEDVRDKSLANKALRFRVKLKEIKKRVLPELNDEFAKEAGGYASIDELRKAIRARLEELEKSRAEAALKNEILARLLEENQFDVPSIMVEDRSFALAMEHQRQLRYAGIKAEGDEIELEKLREAYRPRALFGVKGSILLEKIAEMEGVEVSDAEVEAELEEIARRLGKGPAETEKENARERIKQRLIESKVFERIIKKCEIEEKQVSYEERASQGRTKDLA